jgi:hypothetical protein
MLNEGRLAGDATFNIQRSTFNIRRSREVADGR